MKYPRTTRIFRGQLDAAPFAGVFFLLLIFVVLASLAYTPGVRIELPSVSATNLFAAPDKPTIVVAVDANGRYFYQNQMIDARELRDRLAVRVRELAEPPALVVRADKAVTQETWLQLILIARDAGIREAWPAILPRLFDPPGPNVNAPQ